MEKSIHASAAAAIRKELKATFLEIKFSVKAKSYSGGNSVSVTWEDGPTAEEVNAVIKKYQMGHFDGMTDMYEYSNTSSDVPQVKFVFAQRDISDGKRAELVKEISGRFGVDMNDYDDVYKTFRASPNEIVWRAFNGRL